MAASIHDEVAAAVRHAGLTPGNRLIVGLSGGVDSLVLTHVLAELHRRRLGPEIHAVHVNHRLRPEADRDARRVADLARAMGLPLDVVVVAPREWDRVLRQGVEASARAARYAALAAAARSHRTEWVAVAHTMHDQAETVLLRLARGTSLRGVAGMRPESHRRIPLDPESEDTVEIRLLRPLLAVGRPEVAAYAESHGLVPVEDPSNISLEFRRNVVRHRVIPALEEVSEGAVECIARTSRLLRDDADFLDAVAAEAEGAIISTQPGFVSISRRALRAHHPAIQRRVLLSTVEHLVGAERTPGFARIEALRAAVLDAPVSTRVEVGAGLIAWIDYEVAAIGSAGELEAELRRASGLPLLEPGTRVVLAEGADILLGNGWRLRVREAGHGGRWVIRTRRPGDRAAFPGGPVIRLQDWFVNRKVAAYVRDWLPVLSEDGTVRWVGGVSPAVFRDEGAGVDVRLERLEGEGRA